MKTILITSVTAAFMLILTVPAFAAQAPVAESQKTSTPDVDAGQQSWHAESIKGSVWAVDLTHKILTVKDSAGVPFDIKVVPSTRIESDEKKLTFGDLFSADHVSVEFVPERSGDVAESIRVGIY